MSEAGITSFDELLAAMRADDAPKRLLVVLLRVDSVHRREADGSEAQLEGEGTLSPVVAHDLPVDDTLSFERLVREADEVAPGWSFLMTAVLAGRDRVPATEDAAPHLQRMATAVTAGEGLAQYAVFDRSGDAIRLQPAETQ